MARSISSSVKYLKLGDFEVEFPDTIACDPNGSQLEIQLYNLVLASAAKYLKEQLIGQGRNIEHVRIEAGPGDYLGYYTSDPMQFSYYNSPRKTETHWILELTSYSKDGRTAFLIKSNSAGYHWNYQQKSNVIRLQEDDQPGQLESNPENLFFIDENVHYISPFDAIKTKAVFANKTPPLDTPFESIALVGIKTVGGNPLTVRREWPTADRCHQAVPKSKI